ncbi:hypothetical protein [Sansalvadorimonas verongulae]|uniref:hypothetical protein n=1 Tax=Sansalvadorimonas verongulae TaxID=2172824 RepID=UPI0012BC89C8|nr:hypothetical protein [Sansalvadorimonas verongulae]MTI12521.1 hypothetical protein [Sansalvadorimonas verongulae]
MSKQDAYPQAKHGQENHYNEKLKNALYGLSQMNASLINMEEKLTLQNVRCKKIAAEMKELQKSLAKTTSPHSKPS